ncbi:MAG: isoprenylcysteine carboxylmethyltransferase family protein [Shinella sp.]|nr:MAG: isoprenylcysteine carboxylmethyltransferase family protein [Shinella sp.]
MSLPDFLFPATAIIVVVVTLLSVLQFYRLTGRSPVVLKSGDDALGFSTRLFRILIIAILVEVTTINLWPDLHGQILGRVPALDGSVFRIAGIVLWTLGGVLIMLAQWQMGSSWKIGIDSSEATRLVDTGLFVFSRNPIYLGMVTGLAGLALISPEALSFAILVATWVSLSYQIRMEEAFLEQSIGQAYLDYRKRVRRWL